MRRSAISLLVLGCLAAAGPACNPPSCGPGTKEVQSASGALTCVSVDAIAPLRCSQDGGVHLVAGDCVSDVACGPNTTFDAKSGLCVGSGAETRASCDSHARQNPCGVVPADKACLYGDIRTVEDHACAAEKLHVNFYLNPLTLLGSSAPPAPDADLESDAFGTYAQLVDAGPMPGLVAITTTESGVIPPALPALRETTAVGAQNISGGHSYQIDLFSVRKTTFDGWSAQGGINYEASGAYLMELYCDAAESMPAGGVVPVADGSPASMPRFLDPDLLTIRGSDTHTSASTGALLIPGDASTHTYTGLGHCPTEGSAFESFLGASTPHLVLVTRFHWR